MATAENTPGIKRRNVLFYAAAGIGFACAPATVHAAPESASHAVQTAQAKWDAALADYKAKRRYSDVLEENDDYEEGAVDAYCSAMDHLIEEVPSPNVAAATMKLELALERSESFEGLFPKHQKAILADLHRISGQGAA